MKVADKNAVRVFADRRGISYADAMRISDQKIILTMRRLAELLEIELPDGETFRLLDQRDILPKTRIDEGDLGQTVRMEYEFVAGAAPRCFVDFYNPPHGQPLLRIFFQHNMGEISCAAYQGGGTCLPDILKQAISIEGLPLVVAEFLSHLQTQLYCPDHLGEMEDVSAKTLFPNLNFFS